MLYIFGVIFIKPLAWLIFRPKIKGRQHLRIQGSAIIVSNHWSLGDPVLIGIVCPRIVHFMAKQELFRTPVSRFFMKMLFAFPVNRKHVDMPSLKKAMAVLDKGRVFGIFPEGKRSITGELDDIEKGAAFLALRSGAPIIPVYSNPNTYRKLRIRMIVGEPMDAAQIAKTRQGKPVEVVTDAITNRLMELRAEMEAM